MDEDGREDGDEESDDDCRNGGTEAPCQPLLGRVLVQHNAGAVPIAASIVDEMRVCLEIE